MKDVHIHIERGPYTKEWIDTFVKQAVEMGLDEISSGTLSQVSGVFAHVCRNTQL